MDLKTLSQFILEQYGEIGTPKPNAFERGYETYKLGVNLQNGSQKRLPKN